MTAEPTEDFEAFQSPAVLLKLNLHKTSWTGNQRSLNAADNPNTEGRRLLSGLQQVTAGASLL